MQIKINDKKEMPLLARTEISGEIYYDSATPSRQELRKEVSKALKAHEETVIVKEIVPVFGAKKSLIRVNIYKTPEDMGKYESPVILKRNTKAPKGQEAKEAAKEEAKTEARKESKKEAQKEAQEEKKEQSVKEAKEKKGED